MWSQEDTSALIEYGGVSRSLSLSPVLFIVFFSPARLDVLSGSCSPRLATIQSGFLILPPSLCRVLRPLGPRPCPRRVCCFVAVNRFDDATADSRGHVHFYFAGTPPARDRVQYYPWTPHRVGTVAGKSPKGAGPLFGPRLLATPMPISESSGKPTWAESHGEHTLR